MFLASCGNIVAKALSLPLATGTPRVSFTAFEWDGMRRTFVVQTSQVKSITVASPAKGHHPTLYDTKPPYPTLSHDGTPRHTPCPQWLPWQPVMWLYSVMWHIP